MRKLIAFIFCTLGIVCTYAQYKKPYFDLLAVENGLPESNIKSHLQDKLGYLWLGTQNGLVKYDGYATKLYPMPGDDGKPLIAPTIINLFEDSNATVWVGVLNEGMYYLNRQTDDFVKAGIAKAKGYALKQDILSQGIEGTRKGMYWLLGRDASKNLVHLDLYDTDNNTIQHFYKGGDKNHVLVFKNAFSIGKDGSGKIWVSGDSLLSMYDNKTGVFKTCLTIPGHNTWFNDIYADKTDANIIWLTTLRFSNAGGLQAGDLIKLNTQTYTYSLYANNASDSLSIAGGCSSCYVDAEHNVWCMCGNKVSLYNRQKNIFTNYTFKLPFSNTAFNIRAITEDVRHNLWIGGEYPGLFMLQPSTGKTNYYIYGENNIKGELPASVAETAFTDNTGNVWVALQQTGLASLNERRSVFNTIPLQVPINGSSVRKDALKFYNFFPDSDSTVLVDVNTGTGDPYDIYRWNYSTNNYNKLNIPAAGNGSPICIFKDSKGCLWLSCIEHLLCYNPITNTTKAYETHTADSTIPSFFCYSIAEDKYGTVWFGTWRYGLYSYNRQTGKFKHYAFTNDAAKKNTNVLFNGQIKSLLFDKDGILWIGTNSGGITRFDTQTGTFKNIYNQRDGFDCIITIYQDKKGRLWAGSYRSGLFLVNTTTYTYKRYSQQDGLLYDGINSINEDNAGNIWVVTLQRGISVLNPETGDIKNYTAANALPSNDIGDIFRSPTGALTITMPNGVMSLNPEVLQKNATPPSVAIESITCHAANNARNNDTELYVYGRTNIPLHYNENKITFGYTALHYANPALNKYAYKLDGYDKDWIQAGKLRYIMYLNLLPGTYTFHVKACNSDGVWNEEGASITIIIYPPWWQTWWAYSLYAIIVISAIWWFVQYRSRKLLNDKKLLEHTIKLRTAEVLEQKEEITTQRDNLEKTLDELKSTQAQLIQSEKMASLGELTAGIAHEIQNPLNFVNNFSEVSNELIDEIQGERLKAKEERDEALQDDLLNDIKQNLEKINHHGKRADSIVKGMLQHSRTGGTVKEPTNINKLADEYLRLTYHGFKSKDKSFNTNISAFFDESLPTIKVVAQDVGRVLLNIFNNAFYAVQEKQKTAPIDYKPEVSVTTLLADNFIVIKIKDNGIGIPDSIKEKIMQPFFTTKPTGQGTGLGLSLSYDIVVKGHGGNIDVKSVEGEFTEFVIGLPVKV